MNIFQTTQDNLQAAITQANQTATQSTTSQVNQVTQTINQAASTPTTISSIDFASGTYNPTTKVFTTSNGAQYYISSDSCGSDPLNQTCNSQYCSWGPWQEDSTGKSSCPAPCSSYAYKQFSTCPGGKCDAAGNLTQTRMLPCGPLPCATKSLGQFNNCSAPCGGGTQTRSCTVTPNLIQPHVNSILSSPLEYVPQGIVAPGNPSTFSNRSSFGNQRPQLSAIQRAISTNVGSSFMGNRSNMYNAYAQTGSRSAVHYSTPYGYGYPYANIVTREPAFFGNGRSYYSSQNQTGTRNATRAATPYGRGSVNQGQDGRSDPAWFSNMY